MNSFMIKPSKKGDSRMNSTRLTEKIAGVLYITASAAPILTVIPLGFLIAKEPDFLTQISTKETQVMIGVLLELIWGLAVFGIPVMLFPILRKHNEAGALGFLGFRVIEAVGTMIGTVMLLVLISISQEFVNATAQEASYYQILGEFLLTAREWISFYGPGIIFAFSAVCLNYVLYQSQLVPRWLSGWGLLGGTLMIMTYLLQLFTIDLEFLFIIIAVQEMAFALWLIVKGFNTL